MIKGIYFRISKKVSLTWSAFFCYINLEFLKITLIFCKHSNGLVWCSTFNIHNPVKLFLWKPHIFAHSCLHVITKEWRSHYMNAINTSYTSQSDLSEGNFSSEVCVFFYCNSELNLAAEFQQWHQFLPMANIFFNSWQLCLSLLELCVFFVAAPLPPHTKTLHCSFSLYT